MQLFFHYIKYHLGAVSSSGLSNSHKTWERKTFKYILSIILTWFFSFSLPNMEHKSSPEQPGAVDRVPWTLQSWLSSLEQQWHPQDTHKLGSAEAPPSEGIDCHLSFQALPSSAPDRSQDVIVCIKYEGNLNWDAIYVAKGKSSSKLGWDFSQLL